MGDLRRRRADRVACGSHVLKIFALGTSGIGKTPFAEQLAAAIDYKHVRASAWVRRVYQARQGQPRDGLTREAHVAAMTTLSTELLAKDPDACLKVLREEAVAPCVIEGVRNPRDFVSLWDPREDVAVFLIMETPPIAPTEFERGLDVIRAYVEWSIRNGLSQPTQCRELRYRFLFRRDGSPSLDEAVDVAAPWFR